MKSNVSIPPRRADWRARLADYAASVAGKKFRFGQLDCALFAAGAVEAQTGLDLAAEWRGNYRSLAHGLRAIKEAGFSDHIDLVAAHFPTIAPSMARVGDIAVLPSDEGEAALGIVQGPGVYCLTPEGLVTVSRSLITKAFEV